MTVPLGPFSTSRPPPNEDDSPLALLLDRPPRIPPDPPELPDVDNELYARLIGAQFPGSVFESPTVQAIAAMHRARDARVQRNLDDFRNAATATYHTPWGPVRVAVAFRFAPTGAAKPATHDELQAVAVSVGMAPDVAALAERGRADPEQIRDLTQALIDSGHMPTPDPLDDVEKAVRVLMSNYSIGLDCAGYVIQAFQRSRQGSPVPVPQLSRDEGLFNLEHRGFTRVSMDATRPGDIVSLGPPEGSTAGHRLIVYAARDATAADRAWLEHVAHRQSRMSLPQALHVAAAAATAMAKSPNLRVMDLDSSWGSEGIPVLGGVERHAWLHDPTSGRWAEVNTNGLLWVTAQPYEHPIIGAFRPRMEM